MSGFTCLLVEHSLLHRPRDNIEKVLPKRTFKEQVSMSRRGRGRKRERERGRVRE